MPYDLELLQSDVAKLQHDAAGFGTGRLIASNLILTAAHTLWSKLGEGPFCDDWHVRLLRDRTPESWQSRCGTCIWHNRYFDLALFQLDGSERDQLHPKLRMRVASISNNRFHLVETRGFPRASKQTEGRDLIPVFGRLTATEPNRPLHFGVATCDLPNEPHSDWRGMSGSAVILQDWHDDTTIWLYGVIQKVPKNFDGKLYVAKLTDAWQDKDFRALLVAANAQDEDAEDPLCISARAFNPVYWNIAPSPAGNPGLGGEAPRTPSGGHKLLQPLTIADFHPVTRQLSPAAVIVGHRPSIALVRDRQYMPRAKHLEALQKYIYDLRQVNSSEPYRELQVVWIGGASGSGKTVLLLQLMEALVRDGRTAIWLDDSAAALVEAIDLLVLNNGQDGVVWPEFIFIDDVYSPRNQEILNIEQIRRNVTQFPGLPWPFIVTCGPSEYQKRFSQDTAQDGIVTRQWKLPLVDSEEANAMEKWFSERGSTKIFPLTAIDKSGGLFISMAFELRHGRLDAFAQRFCSRIKAVQLVESLCVPIALNRLYLTAPTEWLSEEERERLAEINADQDFSILQAEEDREYLRLTHPHISDAIYRQLRYPQNPRAYANDLVKALQRSMASDITTLMAILRICSRGDERLDGVDLQHLTKEFGALWRASAEKLATLSSPQRVELLIHLTTWNERDTKLNIEKKLGETLIDKTREVLAAVDCDWSRYWLMLQSAVGNNSRIIIDGIEFLEKHVHGSDPLWHIVFKQLSKAPAILSTQDSQRWIDVGLKRVSCEQPCLGVGLTLETLIRAKNTTLKVDVAQLSKLTINWLDRNTSNHRFPTVCVTLLKSELPFEADYILELSIDWLTRSPWQARAWGAFWPAVLGADAFKSAPIQKKLLLAGVKFLSLPEFDQVNSYLIEGLLKKMGVLDNASRAVIIERSLVALKEQEDRPDWSFLFEHLLDFAELPETDRQQLLEIGLNWLLNHMNQADWAYVWNDLLTLVPPGDDYWTSRLLQVAANAISSPKVPRYWGGLCPNLIKKVAGRPRDALVDQIFEDSLRLIKADRENGAGPLLACRIIENDTDLERIDDVAVWLAEGCTRSTIPYSFRRATFEVMPIIRDMAKKGMPGARVLNDWVQKTFDTFLTEHEVGSVVTGRVVNVTRHGAFIQIADGINGLLHKTEFSQQSSHTPLSFEVGQELSVWIKRIDHEHNRIELTQIDPEISKAQTARAEAFRATLNVGDRVLGKIKLIVDYGVFVELADGVDALLHKSEFLQRTDEPAALFENGQELPGWIKRIGHENGRIALTQIDPKISSAEANADTRENPIYANSATLTCAGGGSILSRFWTWWNFRLEK